MSGPTLDPVPDAVNDPVAQRDSDRRSDLEAADTRSEGGSVHFDVRESTPNSSGPQGAAGGMGVSSEREGPDAPEASGHGPAGHGITGTGTVGDARTRTDGVADSSPHQWDAPDIALGDSGIGDSGAGGGSGTGARTTGALSGRPETTGRSDREDELAYAEGADSGAEQGPVRTEGREGVDRTVGEQNTMLLGEDKPHDTGRDNPL